MTGYRNENLVENEDGNDRNEEWNLHGTERLEKICESRIELEIKSEHFGAKGKFR